MQCALRSTDGMRRLRSGAESERSQLMVLSYLPENVPCILPRHAVNMISSVGTSFRLEGKCENPAESPGNRSSRDFFICSLKSKTSEGTTTAEFGILDLRTWMN